MLDTVSSRLPWDRMAIGLSGMCAIHCVGTVLLLGAVSSLGELLSAPIIHEVGLAVAILLGAIAIGIGAFRHGELLPVAIGSLGLGVMAGALSLPHGAGEAIYTITGVAILSLGHYLNIRAGHATGGLDCAHGPLPAFS